MRVCKTSGPESLKRDDKFLSSLFSCGECGGNMACHSHDSGGRRYHYLRCVARNVGRVDHEVVAVRYDAAVDAVWGHVWAIIRGGDLEAALRQRAREKTAFAKHDRSGERIAAIDAELAGNARAFGGGLLSYEALDSVNKPLMAERARLQAAMDAQASDPGDSVADAARALGKRGLLRLVREADADAQLAFLSVLFDRVEVLPGRVLRVVHSGGVLPDVELELGARE